MKEIIDNKRRVVNSVKLKPRKLRNSINVESIKEKSQEKLHNKELRLNLSPQRKINKIQIKIESSKMTSSKQLSPLKERKKQIYNTIEQKHKKLSHFQSQKIIRNKDNKTQIIQKHNNISNKLLDFNNNKNQTIKTQINNKNNNGKIEKPNSNQNKNISDNTNNSDLIYYLKKGNKSFYHSENNLFIKKNYNEIKDFNDNGILDKEIKDGANNKNNIELKLIKEDKKDSKEKDNIKKEENEANKSYSESDLGVGGEIIEEEESDIGNELNELEEKDKVYYYEPQSMMNHPFINFTNQKNNKHQSHSVSKENKISHPKFSNSLNVIQKNNLFNPQSKKYHHKLKSEKFGIKLKISSLEDKINLKKNEIEKTVKIISNLKKEIVKYNNDIRTVNKLIKKEEEEGEELRQMINYLIKSSN